MVNKGRIYGELGNFLEISLKFNQIRQRIEIRNWAIYDIKKDNSNLNPRNQKSSDLDYNSRRNRSLKMGENSIAKFE